MLLPLLFGYVAILAAAVFHNFALEQIARMTPRKTLGKRGVSLIIFSLLALVHLLEISAFAAYNYAIASLLWQGSFGPGAVAFTDVFYVSGISFTTLGFSQIEVHGPLRIVTMMQSLAGFMLLTWSAGYLYAGLGRYWREER